MKKTRRCACCGREFTAYSGVQKYCSVGCADEAKKERKKRHEDFLRAAEPVVGLRQQEYLTFSRAAILMGCSRQYVYKLVNQGKLKASRISIPMLCISSLPANFLSPISTCFSEPSSLRGTEA